MPHSISAISTKPNTPSPPRRGRRRVTSSEGPDPIDIHVGARMRLRRTLLGLTQGGLGKALGLTFQQIQKYERGSNRIAASTLHRLAHVLDVPVSFFFDDMPVDMAIRPSTDQEDALTRRESLELLRHYYRVPEAQRKQVYDLIKAMGRGDGGK